MEAIRLKLIKFSNFKEVPNKEEQIVEAMLGVVKETLAIKKGKFVVALVEESSKVVLVKLSTCTEAFKEFETEEVKIVRAITA